MNIDVRETDIVIEGKVIPFPASYDSIREILGEARIFNETEKTNYYIYDKLGIVFSDAEEGYLKRRKAFIDLQHMIVYVSVIIDGADLLNKKAIHEEHFVGNITFFGDEWRVLKHRDGSSKYLYFQDNELKSSQISAIVGGNDTEPNYKDGRFTKTLYLSFTPERPKSDENYNISEPEEECVTFTNFNFKLAVVQELMYSLEILKPYFDIYDYLSFKKSRANTETEKNIRAAVEFFKKLPVPQRLANELTEITMDGGNEIYSNIAPLWDGEDERFDLNEISREELKCFPNLRKITIMSIHPEKTAELFREYDIEVDVL